MAWFQGQIQCWGLVFGVSIMAGQVFIHESGQGLGGTYGNAVSQSRVEID